MSICLSVCPSVRLSHAELLSPQLILGAKCHMVRDTQILEKQLVAKELEEEERRLAEMMEVERQKANEMQEELERRRKQELIRRAGGALTSCRHRELLTWSKKDWGKSPQR